MQSIAQNIKTRMTNRGMSAHALEKNAGLRNSAVQNILYGRSKNPSIKILSAIAHALECDVTDLISTTTENSTPVRTPPPPSSSSENNTTSPWNPTLYFSCFETVKHKINQFPSQLTKDKFLELVEEVYNYSLKQNLDHPDEFFTSWLIERGS